MADFGGASPESISTAGGYGFRAPSLRSGPGMTARRGHCSIRNATLHKRGSRFGGRADDLHPWRSAAAARAFAQRPAVLGHPQPHPDRPVRHFRADLPGAFRRPVAARGAGHRDEARGPQASGAGERHRAPRTAAGLASVTA